ncbi:hypothetical protein LP420_36130 [Massilia sp. B-10]|nr:hypothetical protein LP420_36130 [Massilia sp. B-10]
MIVLPNLLFVGALLMLLAATTRSDDAGVRGRAGLPGAVDYRFGALTRELDNVWVAVLIDPFGLAALRRATRYFSTAEANSGLPELGGYLLANRALWTSGPLAMCTATIMLFKPQRA